jgi:hypothetical protein
MWAAANRLGFAGGRILEPGMGVGNFFARIPDQLLHESELFGVEKNPLGGALASMLYPDAKILVQPFDDTRLPNNSFDLIIGKPPSRETRQRWPACTPLWTMKAPTKPSSKSTSSAWP